MNVNKVKENSLYTFAREISPLLSCSDSAVRMLCTVENFETDLQNLEARIEIVQQEIAILIDKQ